MTEDPHSRDRRLFHVEHLPDAASPAPGHCRECGCNSVPCLRCLDDDEVPKRYPLTDQVRDVTHVGICPQHGLLWQQCEVRTHYIRPIQDRDDGTAMVTRASIVRSVMLAILLGFIAGVLFGLIVITPTMLMSR